MLHAMFLTFLFVFAFNLAPAFTPPTWMVLAYIAAVHHPARLLLAIVGAVAATCGRMTLARCSTWLVSHRLLASRTIENLNVVSEQVRSHERMTAALMFRGFTFWFPMLPGLVFARQELGRKRVWRSRR